MKENVFVVAILLYIHSEEWNIFGRNEGFSFISIQKLSCIFESSTRREKTETCRHAFKVTSCCCWKMQDSLYFLLIHHRSAHANVCYTRLFILKKFSFHEYIFEGSLYVTHLIPFERMSETHDAIKLLHEVNEVFCVISHLTRVTCEYSISFTNL